MKRHATGFTLVEVVIAAALFSLIMLGLLSAMRGMADSAGRITQHTERIDNIRLISDVLRNLLSSAQDINISTDSENHLPALVGSTHELIWIAPMPAYHGTGGLHLFRLAAMSPPGDARTTLTLSFVPFSLQLIVPNWSAVDPYILIPDVQNFNLGYQGVRDEQWLEDWSEPALPARISVHISSQERNWPEIIIPIYRGAP